MLPPSPKPPLPSFRWRLDSWCAGCARKPIRVNWMTTADLARSEFVKPQSMGTTLADLEQAGLVRRRPHPTDGRQVLFGLTVAGTEARRKRNVAKREWLLAAMAKLDADEQQSLISA